MRPTRSTGPDSVTSPVIATSPRTTRPANADTSAAAIATPADAVRFLDAPGSESPRIPQQNAPLDATGRGWNGGNRSRRPTHGLSGAAARRGAALADGLRGGHRHYRDLRGHPGRGRPRRRRQARQDHHDRVPQSARSHVDGGAAAGLVVRGNPLSRLKRGPKHHLADPALAAPLLDRSAATWQDLPRRDSKCAIINHCGSLWTRTSWSRPLRARAAPAERFCDAACRVDTSR